MIDKPPIRYVRVNFFCEWTGYSDKAVRRKIQEGVWIEDREYTRAPDGGVHINIPGYEKWVETKPKAGSKQDPQASESRSSTRVKPAARHSA